MRELGLIGLGNAGKPIAERLLSRGYRLRVYDLNPEPMTALAELGAFRAVSAAAAVAETTLIVLPSSHEVKAAAFGDHGVLSAIQPGYVLIDLSGTDPNFARELDAELNKRSAHFLGATLHAAGAPAVTIPKGLLSIVVGGNKSALEKCLGILKELDRKSVV